MLIGSTKYLQPPPFNDLHELCRICNTNGEWDPTTAIPGYKDLNNLLRLMTLTIGFAFSQYVHDALCPMEELGNGAPPAAVPLIKQYYRR
jgi:hypothetical protein